MFLWEWVSCFVIALLLGRLKEVLMTLYILGVKEKGKIKVLIADKK